MISKVVFFYPFSSAVVSRPRKRINFNILHAMSTKLQEMNYKLTDAERQYLNFLATFILLKL